MGSYRLYRGIPALRTCAVSPIFLIAARALQGISGALLFPQVLSIIQVTFPQRERAKAFGLFGTVIGCHRSRATLWADCWSARTYFISVGGPSFSSTCPLAF